MELAARGNGRQPRKGENTEATETAHPILVKEERWRILVNGLKEVKVRAALQSSTPSYVPAKANSLPQAARCAVVN